MYCESNGVVSECIITGNSAVFGGGTAGEGTILNCTIAGNHTDDLGGGTYEGTVRNCVITGNSSIWGGGSFDSVLQNCTVVGNSAERAGGGTLGGMVQNSIVYYNVAEVYENGDADVWEHSCTTPLPSGNGNIADEPGLSSLGNPRIVSSSPCIDLGTNMNWMLASPDIDGESRINMSAVDIGADEFHAGGLTGAINAAFNVNHKIAAAGFPMRFESEIEGRVIGYEWLWGDGLRHSNAPVRNHAYHSPGDYQVVLRAWNIEGSTSVTTAVRIASQFTNYVSTSGSHEWPYTNWSTAAMNIQSAIDAHGMGGLVLVSNGVYDTGGVVVFEGQTNRIAITNGLTVQSVNGPKVTIINGQGPSGSNAIRCVYLGSHACLRGFTLTEGHTAEIVGYVPRRADSGGGAFCESDAVVSNCVVAGNSAADRGGGVYNGMIYNCVIVSNSAYLGGGIHGGTVQSSKLMYNSATNGGGAYLSTTLNCIVSGNSADKGGGLFGSTIQSCTIVDNVAGMGGGDYNSIIHNSILYYNVASSGSNYWYGGPSKGSLAFSCTSPDPGGIGNITNSPGFANHAAGDYHLAATSTCIDAGTLNELRKDFAGISRPLDGDNDGVSAFDIGAYEYVNTFADSDRDGLMDSEEIETHATDPANEDTDGDGMKDGDEVSSGTHPQERTSYLGMVEVSPQEQIESPGIQVSWSSVSNKQYSLFRSTNLLDGTHTIFSNIPATPGVNTYTDTTATGAVPYIYWIQVDP